MTPAHDERKRFLIFLLTGGLAACVNVLVRLLLSNFMSFQVAVVVAYLIAMVTAYALSRRFVFETSGRSVGEELTKFALVNLVAIVQVWLITMALNYYLLPAIGWTFYPELTAHMVGVASPVFTSYFGHKYFSFRAAERRVPDKPE